jgi:hypothetical protein
MVEVITPLTIGAAMGFITHPTPDSQSIGARLRMTALTVKFWRQPLDGSVDGSLLDIGVR